MEKIPNLFSAPNIRTTQKDVTRDDEEGEEGGVANMKAIRN